MKKYRLLSIVFLICLIVLAVSGEGLAADKDISGELTKQLDNYVDNFIREDVRLRNLKIESLEITPKKCQITDDVIEQVFEVNMTTLCDYAKVEDSPVFKAKLQYIEDNKANISKKALGELRKDLENWRADLAEYIVTPSPAFERLKVTANLGKDGSIIPDSIELFGEDHKGQFVPRLKCNIKSATIANDVRDASELIVEQSEFISPEENIGISAIYDRIAARDYVNRWSSNTDNPCRTGSTTKQDKSKYNNEEYPNPYTCNDCANYVSQGLVAGGIQPDNTWYFRSSTWVNVFNLENYMKNNKGYWVPTNTTGCVAGYPVVDTDGDGHIVMISYNDGTTMRYSAHTSDHANANFYYPTNARYYRVTY